MLKNKLIFIILILFFLTGCKQTASTLSNQKILDNQPKQISSVLINGEVFQVELATTKEQQIKGLAGRENIANNFGMLFVYDDYILPGFWMKDMLFPLDIIWLRDNIIIGWETAAVYLTNDPLSIYYPPTPINNVLEVPAGTAVRLELKVGQKVTYQ